MASVPAVEDQARLLEDALAVVRQQTQLMRKCLETPGKLMDALKCCSTLVSELRTSSLSPKQYYELYMAVLPSRNIVPRLYLMITVGTVYMSIEDAPVKEIMKDMMEMSRGVQHPIRGLFLRYYLSGQARDYLPTGSGDGPEGNLQDSISFTLTNFVEMNKLWVRLQHQGHSREREQRTEERKQLQLLVGNNLVRLSQLVDLETYKNSILQPLLEQVVQCRDVLAQEYLLEVITQVFPDEYHLHTLDQFLAAVSRLNPHVNVKVIVSSMMDRLSAYAAREAEAEPAEDREKMEEEAVAKLIEKLKLAEEKKAQEPAPETSNGENATADANGSTEERPKAPEQEAEPPKEEISKPGNESEPTNGAEAETESSTKKTRGIPESIRLYEIFFEQVMNLVNAQHLPIQDTTALLVSLANLALNVYPERLDYVDQILEYANSKIKQHANSADLHHAETQNNILNLLLAPTKSYTGSEEVSYEFFAQAFTIYEEAISDSRAQFQAVCVIAAALHETRNFSKENYDTLITKCALHGSKLLKKPDQCRAVYLASHLWWAVPIVAKGEEDEKGLYRDGKRVLECLQRALRVADACMDAAVSVELFVEILNRYVYYFDQQNEAVTTKYLNGLIELIHSNLQTNQETAAIDMPKRHFQRTLEYIRSREYEGVVTSPAK
ncbi:hypothetical protein DH86_00003071 [Scytalidium sp. 3C]|nr:hypothetical protein DH86_00003071 [Scytalidium sp. 3C]